MKYGLAFSEVRQKPYVKCWVGLLSKGTVGRDARVLSATPLVGCHGGVRQSCQYPLLQASIDRYLTHRCRGGGTLTICRHWIAVDFRQTPVVSPRSKIRKLLPESCKSMNRCQLSVTDTSRRKRSRSSDRLDAMHRFIARHMLS